MLFLGAYVLTMDHWSSHDSLKMQVGRSCPSHNIVEAHLASLAGPEIAATPPNDISRASGTGGDAGGFFTYMLSVHDGVPAEVVYSNRGRRLVVRVIVCGSVGPRRPRGCPAAAGGIKIVGTSVRLRSESQRWVL